MTKELRLDGELRSSKGTTDAVPVTVQFSAPNLLSQSMRITFPKGGPELAAQSGGALAPVSFGTQLYLSPQGSIEPLAGEQYLDPEKALGCPPQYLFQEIADRIALGPVGFRFRQDEQIRYIILQAIRG